MSKRTVTVYRNLSANAADGRDRTVGRLECLLIPPVCPSMIQTVLLCASGNRRSRLETKDAVGSTGDPGHTMRYS
jgi:hypothetical protein